MKIMQPSFSVSRESRLCSTGCYEARADFDSDRLPEDLEVLIRRRSVLFDGRPHEREKFLTVVIAAFKATLERIYWNEKVHQVKPASQTLGSSGQSPPQSKPSRQPNPVSFDPEKYGGALLCFIVSLLQRSRQQGTWRVPAA
jgi:hypothetical protein